MSMYYYTKVGLNDEIPKTSISML